MRRSAMCVAALLAAGGAVIAAQTNAARQERPTFRAEVNYVEVDVLVTDAQGQFVPGLTASAFELFEGDRRQEIQAFSEVNIPVERRDQPLYSSEPIPSDVASNTETAGGRVYLLLLDDLHTTPSGVIQVRRRAREFIERYMGSNDLVAVLHTSGRGDVSQDFTSNRALVLDAIDGFMARGLNSAVLNRMADFASRAGTPAASDPARDFEARERIAQARGVFLTIRNLAEYLSSLSGRRKALLYFSEGIDLDGDTSSSLLETSTFHEMQEARAAMLEAMGAATRANVHIYSIDADGMTGGGAGAELSIVGGEAAAAQGLTTQAWMSERRRAQGTLRTLAEQTGGAAIVNTNAFAEGFARIQRDNSAYYLLGFYPSSRDGKFHKLTVRVKGRPDLQVRARSGFYAAKAAPASVPTAPNPIADMLTAPVPTAGLPIRVALPVFKKSGSEATVLLAVEVPGDVFRFEPAGAAWAEDFELVYQVLDPNAKVVANSSQSVEMRVRAETREMVEGRGFRAVFPVAVKPGRYQVRLAGRTANGGKQGSVFADLVVPDFFESRLVWSGVSLTSAQALRVPTRPADAGTSALIPVMPAAIRDFGADDILMLYAEAYDNDTRASHAVDLSVEVRDATGRVLFSAAESRSSDELGGGRGGYGFRADIPLANLPAGSYVLTLKARSRASGSAESTREVPFEIS